MDKEVELEDVGEPMAGLSGGVASQEFLSTPEGSRQSQKSICGPHDTGKENHGVHFEVHDARLYKPVLQHTSTHTGERPHRCADCRKGFAQLAHLKRHQLTHTGELPYNCTICGKSFAESSSLRIHQRAHTGERPYRCADCGKGFARVTHLGMHQRTHTRKWLHRCTDCGKSFSQSSKLRRHQRTHRGTASPLH
ncbi:Zinc finger and SCAN domain-containing protein 2 [Chelonia mydas]|uniref:Zinc finger and SCAN domain-containing protein 2 n=1 Tax=Chelonia mydas TaxID=8469 RepID=M7ANB0_CHEMY|nr:Zinc finger and SCAN domain-containing protein 2 [Chelonia mydas]